MANPKWENNTEAKRQLKKEDGEEDGETASTLRGRPPAQVTGTTRPQPECCVAMGGGRQEVSGRAQNSPEDEKAGNPKHDEGDSCAQRHNGQS